MHDWHLSFASFLQIRYRDLKLQDCLLEECRHIEGLLTVSLPFSDRRDCWHFTKAPQLHS